MSASYSSSNYDSAAKKYEELQKKYSGEAGYDLASKEATKAAGQAGQAASTNAAASARASGMSKAQAASTGASNGANATLNAYGSAQSQALANNQNTINNEGQKLSFEANKDQNRWQSEQNKYNAWLGGIGGLATGIAQGLSDGNAKNIKYSSKNERCDELIKRLKGEK